MGFFDFFKKKKIHDAGLSPINGTGKLPTKIDDFEPQHYKVLRRVKNQPVDYQYTGLMALEVDIPKFIPILIKLNLIKIGTYEQGLNALKVDELKAILRLHGQKVSGTKSVLIERIIENIDEDEVRQSEQYSDIYVHTDIAKPVIDASYKRFDAEDDDFHRTAINLILSNKLDSAYRMICKKNAELPISPGINVDWESAYYCGLKESQKNIYVKKLKESEDKKLTALAIFLSMGGNIHKSLKQSENISIRKSVNQELKHITAERDRQDYISTNTKKYKFLACLDERTCPICGALDGKIFAVDDIKPGENYPPMHEGCRCTTVAAFDGFESKGTRFARHPITHKGMQVPVNMTYMDYKKEYLDQ